jgi:hypothetical protein
MSAAAAGLIGALIGAVSGLAGALVVQIMKNGQERRTRLANLAAQLTAGAYLVAVMARSTTSSGTAFTAADPTYQQTMFAAAEVSIIAPPPIADAAKDIANQMTYLAGATLSDDEWDVGLEALKQARIDFVDEIRRSKLAEVAKAGAVMTLKAATG